jgi:hypothetical protein
MHDTSSEMMDKMHEMIQQKTPIERLKMGCSMYETSKTLVLRFILAKNPSISRKDLIRDFFLKFYQDDFSPTEREKIILHLQKADKFKPD